jgi:GT2 family glycosyltransferase
MNSTLPFFSIVIPTYNRPDRLVTCLDAILKLNYPQNCFEVVIVDDGSKTHLDSVIEPLGNQLNLKLIRQENSGPAAARNAGAMQVKGSFLVFTDDDCIPTPNWLSELATQFAKTPDYLIGGQTLNALTDNLYSTASQILIDYIYQYFNVQGVQSNFFASNNFAMPTEQFHALGGFDTAFPLAAGEDREFCDRWLHRGYKMTYAPKAQIYHAHHLTLRKFWRQHFNYGRGAFCFHQIRAQRTQDGIKVEPISFYFRLLTFPFSQLTSQPAVLLSGLLFLSQVANIFGFFWQKSVQSK